MNIPIWLFWWNLGTILALWWWGNVQWRTAKRYREAAIEYERRVHDLLARPPYPQGGRQ